MAYLTPSWPWFSGGKKGGGQRERDLSRGKVETSSTKVPHAARVPRRDKVQNLEYRKANESERKEKQM